MQNAECRMKTHSDFCILHSAFCIMSSHPFDPELPRRALARYDESLLRQVAARLLRPRNQWPADELIDRAAAALDNAPVIDRRLKELPPACRALLALVGVSRQPRWRVGPLLGLLAALGHAEGLTPVLRLFEEGLLFPELPESGPPLRSFEAWAGGSGGAGLVVWSPPAVTGRCTRDDLDLPNVP